MSPRPRRAQLYAPDSSAPSRPRTDLRVVARVEQRLERLCRRARAPLLQRQTIERLRDPEPGDVEHDESSERELLADRIARDDRDAPPRGRDLLDGLRSVDFHGSPGNHARGRE